MLTPLSPCFLVLHSDEFIAATLNQSKIEQEAYMLRAFQQFDADNSGYITQVSLVSQVF